MVLKDHKPRRQDPYLNQILHTERLDLVPCNWRDTCRITLPWSTDPELLHRLMYPRASYKKWQWYLTTAMPNGRTLFFHAVVEQESGEIIGGHRLQINRSGTVTMGIALTNKDWWGKDVFEEVRVKLMDHFSRSPRVIRFSGQCLSRNFSSVYNYNKLGFRMVGYETKLWRSPMTGEHMDAISFEYLAEDWRAKRALEVVK